MAYAPHYLFEFGGHLDGMGNGSWTEVWQCGIRARAVTTVDPMAWLTNAFPGLNGWWVAPTKGNSPGARLEWMKLNAIGADGRYSDPTHPNTLMLTDPQRGGATVGAYPTDMSLAYSWTTPLLRGPGHTGRVYVPNAWSLQTAYSQAVSAAAQGNALSAAHDLIGIVNGANAGGDLKAVVASKVTGVNTDITGVRVGIIVDDQRRRRNKLPELYVATSV